MKQKTLNKLENVLKKILLCSILLLVFLGVNSVISYVLNYHHEGVHESICILNEGKVVEKHISSIDGYVKCSIENENIIKGFMLTDIVGYHLIAFVKVLEIFIFVILSFIIIIRK